MTTLGVAALVGTPVADAYNFVLRGNNIGGFAAANDRGNAIRRAINVFGNEDGIECSQTTSTLDWSKLGLEMTFTLLPPSGAGACYRGAFEQARITGRRWRTAAGLRVGASFAAMRRLYPRARRESDYGAPGVTWGLVPNLNPSLQAVVRRGRVAFFRVYRYGHA